MSASTPIVNRVPGIGIELSLILRLRLDLDGPAVDVGVAFSPGQAVNAAHAVDGVHAVQAPQHVIERAVLHYENHEMLQCVQPRRHGHPLCRHRRRLDRLQAIR